MSDLPKPKTSNPHEATWDHHGSYQWGYFADEVKSLIKFFLSRKLTGKNIEFGGGWYLSYPNSVVVDLSSVCLQHNPAKEKLQFDLDELGKGKRLPYGDHSFDSATFISVWQYLRHPNAVVNELERIVRPGGEVYLINGQNGGLEECIVGTTRSENIVHFFRELNYDTVVEVIPSPGKINEFQSVCVAMPDSDLFGKNPSKIKDREKIIRKNKELLENPSVFFELYTNYEIRKIYEYLAQLREFPVTQYSQEYLARTEAFSQECKKETGIAPLLFIEHDIEQSLLMLTPENKSFFVNMILIGENERINENNEEIESLLNKYELKFSKYFGYFHFPTTNRVLEHCRQFVNEGHQIGSGKGNETDLMKFGDFISAISLNSFTRELQSDIYNALKPRVKDLDERIEKRKAFGYSMCTMESKQKRRISKLIELKRKIETEGISIIRREKRDYTNIISALRNYVNPSKKDYY